MRNLKAILFFLSLSALLSFTTKAKSLEKNSFSKPDSVEVYLSITHNDDVVINAVRRELKNMQGTSTIAYCDNHAVFLLRYSASKYSGNAGFLEAIQKKVPEFATLLHIKQGEAFADFYKYCEPSDNKELKNIKNELK